MTASVLKEMSVGLTPEIEAALNIAVEFEGIKASQFGRLAILERLVARGYMNHPGVKNAADINNSAGK
jgi:phage portal protein BeeE